jgi:hypothetical protein
MPALTVLNGRLRVASCGGPLVISDSPAEPCCCGCRPAIGTTITFSEYPDGTQISDQYKTQGIIFSGDSPFITGDGANPTSPVLSGSPRFFGNIGGRFVDPADGSTPISLGGFSLDAGYFDNIGETTLEWYDADDNLIGSVSNTQLGIQTFNVSVQPGEPCIRRWYIRSTGNDAAGFAIDNVSF